MERQRFPICMQIGLIFRYFVRNASLALLMVLLLAGALFLQIPIFRSRMDLDHRILLAVIELAGAAFLLYVVWINIIDYFISYTNFRIHVASTTLNQEWLHEMIEKDTDDSVRAAAVRRLSDPEELFSIALQDSSQKIRSVAASVLQDPEKAEQLVALSEDGSVRAGVVYQIKNENVLFELSLHDSDVSVQRNAARKLESTEYLLKILCATKDSEIWKMCLPRLIKQTIRDKKLPIEIASKLKEAPMGDDWLKKPVCPLCYSSEYRVDSKPGDAELVYWASDNVVYDYHMITSTICEGCGDVDTLWIPLSSLFPEGTK